MGLMHPAEAVDITSVSHEDQIKQPYLLPAAPAVICLQVVLHPVADPRPRARLAPLFVVVTDCICSCSDTWALVSQLLLL